MSANYSFDITSKAGSAMIHFRISLYLFRSFYGVLTVAALYMFLYSLRKLASFFIRYMFDKLARISARHAKPFLSAKLFFPLAF